MRWLKTVTTVLPILLLSALAPEGVRAQTQADIDAVHRLLDRYREMEEAMDMAAQSQLIREDRVWIAQGFGRRTDQKQNMAIQADQFALNREIVPGLRWIVEDRDRVVRFFGSGSVAIASFYRYSTYLIPPETPAEIAEGFTNPPASVASVVMEKSAGEWKIVHTHFSNLGPPTGG